jgi:hypothetical protein
MKEKKQDKQDTVQQLAVLPSEVGGKSMYAFQIHGKDGKVIHVSEYIYATEQAAVAASTEWVRAFPSR